MSSCRVLQIQVPNHPVSINLPNHSWQLSYPKFRRPHDINEDCSTKHQNIFSSGPKARARTLLQQYSSEGLSFSNKRSKSLNNKLARLYAANLRAQTIVNTFSSKSLPV